MPSSDPRLFFSVDNIRAFHVQDGVESELTPSGPQKLSLLMVPTTSSHDDPSNPQPPGQVAEEDFYLHLHLPPELELPLPATTQIYHQPPNSYLIPRWDLGPEAGAFTRIQFPPVGNGVGTVSQEDVDTFETILAQCTAFLERSPPPKTQGGYNPANFAPGEGYAGIGDEKRQQEGHQQQPNGQIVLVDEENGSVVGELTQGYNVVSSDVKPGSKDPVHVQLPEEGNQISVSNVPPEYLQMANHPAYAKSTLVQSSATASRLLVTTSEVVSNVLQSGANTFTKKTKPNTKPMTFKPTTQENIRKMNNLTHSAAGISAKTVGQLGKYAQNFGASLVNKGERQSKAFDKNGKPVAGYKPGILNKSMIAISTLGDSVDQSARNLLTSGSQATTAVVGHRYGNEARGVADKVTGGVKNVGLVYIDASGVSRRAVLKSVAKGMVVGRMKDGQQLVVGGGDGGQALGNSTGSLPGAYTPSEQYGGQAGNPPFLSTSDRAQTYPARQSPSPGPPPPPPAYGEKGGEYLGGTPMQDPKR